MHVVQDDEGRTAGRRAQQELPHASEHLPLLLLVGHPDGRRGAAQAEQRGHQDGRLIVNAKVRGPVLQVLDVVRDPSQDPFQEVQERAERPFPAAGDPDVQAAFPGREL